MSQVLKAGARVRYRRGMNTAPEDPEDTEENAVKADPLARLLQCHPETAFDYLEFRRMMAGPAAAFAAERATPQDIDRLRASLRAMEEAGLRVVERVALEVEPADAAMHYLRTKKQKLGHLLDYIE